MLSKTLAALTMGVSASNYASNYTAIEGGSSSVNPGPFVDETWYSGTVPLDHEDDLFYWWFESRDSPKDDPVVLWLTGGPGCASEIALFFENGPYHFEEKDQTKLTHNPYSWNSHANLIYVDQPVGTGFSNYGITHLNTNEEEVAENMAKFMIAFLEKYPQLQGKDFYITGESYAGHYIPAISHNFIFTHKEDLKINFKGMAIGNGFVDPYIQYPAYATFAKENNLIGEAEYLILDEGFKACDLAIKVGEETGVWPFSFDICNLMMYAILGNPFNTHWPKFNIYDIRKPCTYPPLCYDLSATDKLMDQDSIKTILGVSGRGWQECSYVVHTALLGDWMKDLSGKVTDILNTGLDTLVYSGEEDFICNWKGGEAWTNAVAWSGHDDYTKQSYKDWNVSGTNGAAGSLKEYQNLKFLRVHNAGHMVPMDQPEAALQMLTEFITSGPLEKKEEKPEIITA